MRKRQQDEILWHSLLRCLLFLPFFLLLLFPSLLHAAVPWFQFPTSNHALLRGELSEFYMYVDRDFEGKKSYPWQGGQYGLVRVPKRNGSKIVYSLFHEGIDIRPTRRDSRGEPLDDVMAAAAGTVVYISTIASQSNYGKYVVLEHIVDGYSIYTLYAHLKSIAAGLGEQVRQGQKIGELGYTGAGLDRKRAHLHFEVCLMLNQNFDRWYDRGRYNTPNVHKIFNGINLQGINPAALLLAVNADPTISVATFLARSRPMFEITMNAGSNFDLVQRYPFLKHTESGMGGEERNADEVVKAWRITFSQDIIPIRAEPLSYVVPRIQVKWLGNNNVPIRYQSRGLIGGNPTHAKLTPAGMRFVDLLVFTDEDNQFARRKR